jgi:hypothetical protein
MCNGAFEAVQTMIRILLLARWFEELLQPECKAYPCFSTAEVAAFGMTRTKSPHVSIPSWNPGLP